MYYFTAQLNVQPRTYADAKGDRTKYLLAQAMQLEWQIAAIGNTFKVRIAGGCAEKIY